MDTNKVAQELISICEGSVGFLSNNASPISQADHLIDLMVRLKADLCKNIEQKHRWIGYVQGCLISSGAVNLKEMKDLNRRN